MGKDIGKAQVDNGSLSSVMLLSLEYRGCELQAVLIEVLPNSGGLPPSPLIL